MTFWGPKNPTPITREQLERIGLPLSKHKTRDLRLSMIIALCSDYDGFSTVEDLKSLIDDVVKIAKGEMGEIKLG